MFSVDLSILIGDIVLIPRPLFRSHGRATIVARPLKFKRRIYKRHFCHCLLQNKFVFQTDLKSGPAATYFSCYHDLNAKCLESVGKCLVGACAVLPPRLNVHPVIFFFNSVPFFLWICLCSLICSCVCPNKISNTYIQNIITSRGMKRKLK